MINDDLPNFLQALSKGWLSISEPIFIEVIMSLGVYPQTLYHSYPLRHAKLKIILINKTIRLNHQCEAG